MKVLYIDTTTSYLYTGIVVEGKLIEEIQTDFGKDLSSVALKKISEMLEKSNLKPNDIDKIIAVNGPGSFTGIRVGVTIAKTYAYSLKKDITTITSLEAMAASCTDDSYKIPIIDARRGYVYGAIFNKENEIVLKQQYIKLDTIKCAAENLVDKFTYISNQNFDGILTKEYKPNIENIVNMYSNKENENPHSVDPIYLKLTEAEEKQKLELI